MNRRTLVINALKLSGVVILILLTFLLLPILLRYTLEGIIVLFGMQILLYLYMVGILFFIFFSIYHSKSKTVTLSPDSKLFRILNDWKTIVGVLILICWVFFILGFSISAYWLKEFNYWIGGILAFLAICFAVRMAFFKYRIGKLPTLSRFQQISIASSFFLFIIIFIPYFQGLAVQPRVSSEEILKFNSNSDLIPLNARFSMDVYLNGFPLDSSEVNITKNILYNSNSKLDIYHSPRVNASNPLLIIIHGGGWISGSKIDIPIRSVSKFFALHGFTVFAINYRLYPEVTFIGMLHDVRDAIVFAKRNADDYQGDRNRTFLFGRSSGAQLALVAAYGSNVSYFRKSCGNYSSSDLQISGVASIYGISEMSTMGSRILGVKTDEENILYDLASPLSYINKSGIVPTFIAAGSLDALVPVENSRSLHRVLSAYNNTYMYLEIPWANHSFDGVISSLSSQIMLYFVITLFSHFSQ